jgi:uncharacterized protein (TIGR00255 family)
VFHQALDDLNEMREQEGKAIFKDVTSRLQFCQEQLNKIQTHAKSQTARYREKLLKVAEEIPITEDRLYQEVALLAEKVDITEEITRFYSHLEQFRTTLAQPDSIGKKLDFLCQEMMREASTMTAKGEICEVIHSAVEMKAELEKIREQLQNIE